MKRLTIPKNSNRAFFFYLAHVRSRWYIYFWGLISLIGTDLCEVMIPKFTQWMIDAFVSGKRPDWTSNFVISSPYLLLLSALLFVLIIQLFMRALWRVTLGQETQRIASSLKLFVWEKAQRLPRERLERDLNIGELMSLLTSDVNSARLIFGWTLVGLFDCIFVSAFGLLFVFNINAKLALSGLISALFLPFMISRLAKKESSLHLMAQSKLADYNAAISRYITTLRLQRLTNSAEYWIRSVMAKAGVYRKHRQEVVKVSLQLGAVASLAPTIGLSLFLLIGLPAVWRGEITLGEFVACQSYLLLLNGPLSAIGVVLAEWQRGMASLARIISLQAIVPENDAQQISTRFDTSSELVLQAKALSFKYPNTERLIFDNLSFSLNAGDYLGILGGVASGKTTLISTITGLEKDYLGSLKLFAREIKDLSHGEIASVVSVVPQRSFLFANTVRRNLCLDREFSDQELLWALEIADLRQEIVQLGLGLDSALGEWGVNLSGGQKQRLTLARAILRKPKLLLLDDCLSAVDTTTEYKIVEAIKDQLKDMSVLWCAHRSTTLRHCNSIIKLGEQDG